MADNNIFLFDIDGTLTMPRGRIDKDFQKFFITWGISHRVVLVTGSDHIKTIEQLGEDMWSVYPSYQCAGNQLWFDRMLLYENKWEPPKQLLSQLEAFLEISDFKQRYGRHIEVRPGMVNFSIIGRACPVAERKVYNEWDILVGERRKLVDAINYQWPELEASVGGQISIDIYPKGMGKGQIIPILKQSGEIIFFGDKAVPGGNDYTIARQLNPNNVYQVSSPADTRRILETQYGY